MDVESSKRCLKFKEKKKMNLRLILRSWTIFLGKMFIKRKKRGNSYFHKIITIMELFSFDALIVFERTERQEM